MALSLKDPEADRLAREVAARTGETLTTAVVVALSERLARLRGRSKRRRLRDELREIAQRCAQLPTLDDHPSRNSRLRRARIAPLMVLDTSALLALLLDEPEAEEFRAAVEEDTTRWFRRRRCSRRP